MTQKKFNKFLKISSGLGIIFTGFILYKSFNHEQQIKDGSSEKTKGLMISHQKLPAGGMKRKAPIAKTVNKPRSASSLRAPAATRANKRILTRDYESKLSVYLNQSEQGYSWSTTVFAFPATKVIKGSARKIASAIGVNFYEHKSKNNDNYFVVKDPMTKRIGFYSGKVVVDVQGDEGKLKDYLNSTPYVWNKIIKTYVLDVDSIEEAIKVKEELGDVVSPTSVNLDIITNRQLPN